VSAYGRQRRVGESEGSFADRTIGRDVSELTSRERTDQVSDTKRRLGLPQTEKDHIDVALATNMISVGLDITRLGLMVVLGQPKAAAEYIQATSRVGRDEHKPGLVVTLLNIHRPRDRSHFERFEAFHASFYRSVEATSVTPFAPRALDRGLPGVVVAIARHLRAALTAPAGALAIVGQRPDLSVVADLLATRGRTHSSRQTKEEEARLDATLRARVTDLLDSWCKVAEFQQNNSARLRYQPYEGAAGPALLRLPLDPLGSDLQPVQDARKFKASRSLRDVEPSVNLWLKRLDGMAIELPADGEDA
jgi:superfamily II DNA/RNA helicase